MFKKGDKVKVTHRVHNPLGIHWPLEMDEWIGKVLTISVSVGNGGYLVKENDWTWPGSSLCPVGIYDIETPTVKDGNPKDAVGVKKVPFSTISAPVMAEVGLAMLEGARKYGRHNYRVIGVRASVYYDAAFRHLTSWFEGEDIDPDSGLSHITKCIASLSVLRDAMIQGKLEDDRPPASPKGWQQELHKKTEEIIGKYAIAQPAYTEKEHGKK